MTKRKAQNRSAEERRREVEGWRASGQSGEAFARSRGYSHSSLTNWASALRAETSLAMPRMVKLTVEKASREVVVEVGKTRIRVTEGFDAALLRQVVEVLGCTSK